MTSKYPLKKYPVVGACGLDCGLCPRYHTNGRSKSFYCTSCQLIPLDKIKEALADMETETTKDTDVKEKAKLIRAAINSLANSLQIDLKLRK